MDFTSIMSNNLRTHPILYGFSLTQEHMSAQTFVRFFCLTEQKFLFYDENR